MRNHRVTARMLVLLVGLMLLGACGDDGEPATEPAPSPTPLISLTTTAGGTEQRGAPHESSPQPGELTVGQIADRIAAAWPTVRSYRATSQSTTFRPVASPVASPIASPVAGFPVTIVDDVIQPDRRHRYQRVDGQITSELILVGDIVYLRGVELPNATPVATDPNAWVTLDPATIAEDSPYRSLYEGMTAPILAPYSGLSEDERGRIARPAGIVTAGERQCAAYRIADTTLTGERIDVVIAIEDDGLPCSIETRAGSSISVTTFEYNIPLTIEPPI